MNQKTDSHRITKLDILYNEWAFQVHICQFYNCFSVPIYNTLHTDTAVLPIYCHAASCFRI